MPIDFQSLQIQTVNLDFRQNVIMPYQVPSHLASQQLAKFLRSLPYLTNLEIVMNERLPDNFFTELESLTASSQVIRKVSAQAVETGMNEVALLLFFINFHTLVYN